MPSQKPTNNITDWTLSIDSADAIVTGVNDITQCIAIILTTVPGSDPLRPTFGFDQLKYIDKPINEAAPKMVNDIITAIKTWEKRATVTQVDWRVEAEHAVYEISWTSKYGDGHNSINL